MTERTFIMVKPDGVQRSLIADVTKRFEQKGFKLVALKFTKASADLFKKHYAELSKETFFDGLVKFSTSAPVVAMVWEGKDVVKIGRQMLGETDPAKSNPGTIRGDLCVDISRNIVHGSDSVATANREIKLWFKDDELVDWTPHDHCCVYP